jgi:hypothetical protein
MIQYLLLYKEPIITSKLNKLLCIVYSKIILSQILIDALLTDSACNTPKRGQTQALICKKKENRRESWQFKIRGYETVGNISVLVLCTQVNMMFVVFWVYIPTGQAWNICLMFYMLQVNSDLKLISIWTNAFYMWCKCLSLIHYDWHLFL